MRPRASNSKSHDARSSASVKPSILGRGAALVGLESQGANADAIGPTTDRVDQQSALLTRLADRLLTPFESWRQGRFCKQCRRTEQKTAKGSILASEPHGAARVPEVSVQKDGQRARIGKEEQPMTRVPQITRRQALKVTAGAVGAGFPLVHVQTAGAAGK